MALGDTYATLTQLKAYLGVSDTVDDGRLTDALASASRSVDKVCGRQFNDAGVTSARVYYPDSWQQTTVDDFSTAVGLVVLVDMDDDGTYETTWATGDFVNEPLNGIVDGEPGWPFWRIKAVGVSVFFPSTTGPWFSTAQYNWRPYPLRPSVQVTARWGWAAVPTPIYQATLQVAAELFKLKDAPFGVAGFDHWGPVRVRNNPVTMGLIAPYVRTPVLMA